MNKDEKLTGKKALEELADEIKYTHNDGKTLTEYDSVLYEAILNDLNRLEKIEKEAETNIKTNRQCYFDIKTLTDMQTMYIQVEKSIWAKKIEKINEAINKCESIIFIWKQQLETGQAPCEHCVEEWIQDETIKLDCLKEYLFILTGE